MVGVSLKLDVNLHLGCVLYKTVNVYEIVCLLSEIYSQRFLLFYRTNISETVGTGRETHITCIQFRSLGFDSRLWHFVTNLVQENVGYLKQIYQSGSVRRMKGYFATRPTPTPPTTKAISKVLWL